MLDFWFLVNGILDSLSWIRDPRSPNPRYPESWLSYTGRPNYSDGSRRGVRGGPPPPLFSEQTEARRAEKISLETTPSFLSVWMTAPLPPPLSYLKIWIRHWTITHSHHPSWSDPVWVPSIDLISIWREMFHSKLQKLLLYSYWILWKSHGLFQKIFFKQRSMFKIVRLQKDTHKCAFTLN